MDNIKISRLETGEDGTFGALSLNKGLFCWSLEPPWEDNVKVIPCLPTGQYLCEKMYSNTHKCDVLWAKGVDGRDDVFIHPGNIVTQTEGGILVGAYIGTYHDRKAVLRSRNTLGMLMSMIGDKCSLTLTECIGQAINRETF